MKGKILVTGGTGFIGSHTTVELQQAGYEVVIIDNLSNSNVEVLDGIERITGIRPVFVEGDCTDMAVLRKMFEDNPGISGIINFAASKAVGESIEKPIMYYRNNLNILLNLLELMPEFGVKGFVFSSSCTVYGEPDQNPITEDAPTKKATSPYGATKQVSEDIIADVIRSGSPIKAILLRYFNPIGAHPSAEIGELPNGVPQNLVPYLTQTAIGVRKELSIFGNDYPTRDGSCIRDFINVVDLAKAHVKALERMLEDKSDEALEIFNIGTGNGASVLELLHSFERATGVKVPHKIAPRRPGDIVQIWADPKRANKVLGWHAEISLDDTMLSAWNWQKRLRERGITLIVLLVPEKEQLHPAALPPDIRRAITPSLALLDALEAELRTRNIPVANPLPAFQAATASGTCIYWRDDTHWNDAGIRLAAETVWQEMAPILASPPPP